MSEQEAPSKSRSLPMMVGVGVGLAAVISLSAFTVACPCERTPGLFLLGDVVEEPVADWAFANDVALCQIEIRAGIRPHSINLNCFADGAGDLYLSCSQCEPKYWSQRAVANGTARLRLNDSVYPVRLTRVEDATTLDHAWLARARKLGGPADAPRPDHWWSFRVESR